MSLKSTCLLDMKNSTIFLHNLLINAYFIWCIPRLLYEKSTDFRNIKLLYGSSIIPIESTILFDMHTYIFIISNQTSLALSPAVIKSQNCLQLSFKPEITILEVTFKLIASAIKQLNVFFKIAYLYPLWKNNLQECD